jgi:hypothetical protein
MSYLIVFVFRTLFRYLNTDDIIEKPLHEPIAAYKYRAECRTLADLELIRNNEDELHMESLTIR